MCRCCSGTNHTLTPEEAVDQTMSTLHTDVCRLGRRAAARAPGRGSASAAACRCCTGAARTRRSSRQSRRVPGQLAERMLRVCKVHQSRRTPCKHAQRPAPASLPELPPCSAGSAYAVATCRLRLHWIHLPMPANTADAMGAPWHASGVCMQTIAWDLMAGRRWVRQRRRWAEASLCGEVARRTPLLRPDVHTPNARSST